MLFFVILALSLPLISGTTRGVDPCGRTCKLDDRKCCAARPATCLCSMLPAGDFCRTKNLCNTPLASLPCQRRIADLCTAGENPRITMRVPKRPPAEVFFGDRRGNLRRLPTQSQRRFAAQRL